MRACVIGLVSIAAAIGTACGRDRADQVTEAAKSLTVIAPDGSPRMFVGDQDSSGTRFCFEAADTALPTGAQVTVVHPGFPQRSSGGHLGPRSKSPCFPPPRGSLDSMEYVVEAPGDTIGWSGVPIIILGNAAPVVMRGDTVTLVVEPGKPSWRFRTCASTEGIHATAWSGIPVTSRRRWHSYYYLGYDVDPDCAPEEYAPDTVEVKR